MRDFKRLFIYIIGVSCMLVHAIAILLYSSKHFSNFDELNIWSANIYDVMVCLSVVLLVLVWSAFIKVRESSSFVSFEDFEADSDYYKKNIYIDIEVLAQYSEVSEFKKFGFVTILDTMHKINIINRSMTEKKKLAVVTKNNKVLSFLQKLFSPFVLLGVYVVMTITYLVLFTFVYLGYNISYPMSVTLFIGFVIYISILIVEISRGNGETYSMRTFKDKRKNSSYLKVLEEATISKDLVIMGEFAVNIEKLWSSLSVKEFNAEILAIYEHQGVIDEIYMDYISVVPNVESLNIDILDKYRNKLKKVTNFSLSQK